MKTKLIIALLALAAVSSNCLFSGADTTHPKKTNDQIINTTIDTISAGWFRTGAEIGYAVALKGGTRADLQLIIEAQKTNGVGVVSNWFATH